ncbi:conserved hypothetical protein [Trichinella spiralis]|uniref:hypothetical protein n=1 Tax=Trichinella spiralis TaxID=6334 RepID=UPI0001EFDBAD|nr:conserved hypothetical protein [Trichinella spiralis]
MTKTMDARTVTVHPHNTVMNRNDPAHRECDRRCCACCPRVVILCRRSQKANRRASNARRIDPNLFNSFLASCAIIVVAYNAHAMQCTSTTTVDNTAHEQDQQQQKQ